MSRTQRHSLMTGVVVLLASSPVWATPITWTFTGELTQVTDLGSLPSDVIMGMPFTGSFTYEPPILDSLPDSDD